jgi:hypothetical protein
MYDIDVGCSFEGSTTSVIVYWDHFHIYIIYMISENFPKSGETSVVATVRMCSHMPIHNCLRCSYTLCV